MINLKINFMLNLISNNIMHIILKYNIKDKFKIIQIQQVLLF